MKRKPLPKAPEFVIEQDASNGVTLSVRCLEFSIAKVDADNEDLTDADLEMFRRIQDVLNENAATILGDA